MSWTLPLTWTTGMVLSGATADAASMKSLNVNLTANVQSLRNAMDSLVCLSLSSDQYVSNNVYQPITWQSLDAQASSGTALWASASGAKLLAPVVGKYELRGVQEWAANSSVGYRGTAWRIGGSTVYHVSAAQGSSQSRLQSLPFGAVIDVSATTRYVEVMAFQNTGASSPLHGGNVDRTRCTWRLLGATA